MNTPAPTNAPALGADVETILEAWRDLAGRDQHRKQEVFGIVSGIGEFIWRDGELHRNYPRDFTYRPISRSEKLRMYESIRTGWFQVSTCEYGSPLDPTGPAYTEIKIHHQATKVPLPAPAPLWCEDERNIFDTEDDDDGIHSLLP